MTPLSIQGVEEQVRSDETREAFSNLAKKPQRAPRR